MSRPSCSSADLAAYRRPRRSRRQGVVIVPSNVAAPVGLKAAFSSAGSGRSKHDPAVSMGKPRQTDDPHEPHGADGRPDQWRPLEGQGSETDQRPPRRDLRAPRPPRSPSTPRTRSLPSDTQGRDTRPGRPRKAHGAHGSQVVIWTVEPLGGPRVRTGSAGR
jgi:hypothetical protein